MKQDVAMDNTQFKALVVRETEDGQFTRSVETRRVDELPDGALLVRVHFSSLNYKDALSATGHKGVTRRYPHTPGIDAAGVVITSQSDDFAPGDEVIVIGHDLGMNTPGGFGQIIRIPPQWAIKRPTDLSLRESMIYGTAGYTAAMCVERLTAHGVAPDQGPVLVTGATGGVGSMAVALLTQLGYDVTAVTGKKTEHDYLRQLGATEIVNRDEAGDESGRPMLSAQWAGVVDDVGGNILATALKSTRYGGAVVACGNVASPQLDTTVFPFILRAITLYGVDSVNVDQAQRRRLWEKLAGTWKLASLPSLAKERTLDELNPEIERILAGKQTGRVLLNLQAVDENEKD